MSTARELVRERHFVTELVRLGAGEAEMPEAHQCQLWIALEGHGNHWREAYRIAVTSGCCPKQAGSRSVRATEPSRFLRTWVP
jgi:hypothetical protein